MTLSKQHKILILFLSTKNPWWKDILESEGRDVTQEGIFAIANVTRGAYHRWVRGQPLRPTTAHAIFDTTKKHINDAQRKYVPELKEALLKKIEAIRAAFYAETLPHMYDVAGLLSMDVSVSQRLIDEIIYSQFPLFPSIFDEATAIGRERAESKFKEYKGTYELWMRRGEVWLQCPLRVRYPIEIQDGIAIRCKLNVPKMHADSEVLPYWEYDGFVRERENKLFWMFEKRLSTRGDYIYFITDLGSPFERRLTLAGMYLTTAQNGARSIVAHNVLLRRMPVEEVTRMEDAMHSTAQIVEGAQVAEIERLLQAYSTSNDQRH